MSPLAEYLDDYLRLRRGLGFQLGRHGEVLPRFVAYVETSGATTVTVELAVAWARLPKGIKPITVDFRLSAVRGFARYLHAVDPAHEIPPPGLLAVPRRRPTPYIYTPDQIVEVLRATRRLEPPLRAVTYRTLLGLLAATGMRLGEAFALTRTDVDLVEGLVTIRHAKFDRMRLVPLHPSVTDALRAYCTARDRLCPAALLWGAANIAALQIGPSIRRAGFDVEGAELGEALFDAILTSPSGVTFSVDEPDDSWARIRTPGGMVDLDNELMIEALADLATAEVPGSDQEFPLVLSAGERRSFTANTIIRDPAWRKRDPDGALRVSKHDAAALGLTDGDAAILTTKRASVPVTIEISPMMRSGHVSLPNGLGTTETPDGQPVGIAPNDLTSSEHRDPIAGTPYHKHVPARLERAPA